MQNRILKISLVWLLCCQVSFAATRSEPLVLGVLPYLTARTLVKNFEPLRQFLEDGLEQEVQLRSAPSYKSFVDRTRDGKYDLALTSAHFARKAQIDAGLLPLLAVRRDLQSLIVVASDNPASGVEFLRGKRVAIPERSAMTTMMGLHYLREQGIRPDIDVELIQSPSHDASVASVLKGDSVAAITEQSSLMQMPAELKSGVRILAFTAPAPHMTFIMHPRLAPQLRERIVSLIERYANDSIHGRRFFAGAGVRKVSAAEMARLDATLPETEQILKRQ